MRAWLERNALLVLAVSLVLFLVTFAIAELRGGDPPPIEFQYGSGLAPGTPIRVQVAGAVVSPGVYELREGDRVIDALAAAGGPTETAAADELNLARRVRDEERLSVPTRTAPVQSSLTLAPGALIDINTAGEADLDRLPGIGEAYSRRIVDSRRVDGPFKSIEELVVRRVLPQATFERIRDLITVSAP